MKHVDIKLTDRQLRALKVEGGVFNFDSGGDNYGLMQEAAELETAGLIRIETHQYSQHAVYECHVTPKGRKLAAL